MNRHSPLMAFRKISLLPLLFIVGCTSPAHYVERTVPPFTITGTAIDKKSREPIADVKIWGYVEEEDWISQPRARSITETATTDSQGRYKLEVVGMTYRAFQSMGNYIFVPTYKSGYMKSTGMIRHRSGDIRPHETRVLDFEIERRAESKPSSK